MKSRAFLVFVFLILLSNIFIVCNSDKGENHNENDHDHHDDNDRDRHGDKKEKHERQDENNDDEEGDGVRNQGRHRIHRPKGNLSRNTYKEACPQVEDIVREIVWGKVAKDPTLAAKLLRLHYHDCFVRGCDASILLDSVDGSRVEKNSFPNLSIAGYEIIDEIKSRLEEECPQTVSCADIVAITARDAVSYQFQRPLWKVFTGRKDGKVSNITEPLEELPPSSANFSTLLQIFSDNGLDINDLVALSGAHTIGVSHCAVIARRLFNFTGNGDSTDPSLDPDYAIFLKNKCSALRNDRTMPIDMDPIGSLSFDSAYFQALNKHKGLFASDAALLTDPKAASIAEKFQKNEVFFAAFARSIKNMGDMQIIVQGQEGEIRKNCRFVNSA